MEKDTKKEIDRSKLKSKINTWKPKKDQVLVENDGKLFIVHFDKIFNQPVLQNYNRFSIKKNSYENQLDIISKYTNFFINCYDPDYELPLAYLKLKFAIDKERKFNKDNMDALIDFIYEIMFTPSMCEKIKRMVEENYLDDIESGDDKGKYKKNNKDYLESLEFTNQHIKILLRISFGMKIMSPVLFHYLAINVIKIEKGDGIIYKFYERLFQLFSDNVNMFNKLFVYVKTKVRDSRSHNSAIFEQREIMGVDEYDVIKLFVKTVLISENMVKYKFNEHWDAKQKKYKENIVGFNKTIIKYQLLYFLKEQYEKNLTEVLNTKNSEGLSGVDKMEMNLSKIDEGILDMAQINIDLTIDSLLLETGIDISDEEIQYYRDNLYPTSLQIELVYSYYAKYFDSYRDLNLMTRRQYLMLVLLLKKRLLLEAGYDEENNDFPDVILPYILTGNLYEKVNNRLIRNSKFMSKVEENYMYEQLNTKKYKHLQEIKPDFIHQKLSTFINTKFSYVVYEAPELLGKVIEYNEDKLTDEILFFLSNI